MVAEAGIEPATLWLWAIWDTSSLFRCDGVFFCSFRNTERHRLCQHLVCQYRHGFDKFTVGAVYSTQENSAKYVHVESCAKIKKKTLLSKLFVANVWHHITHVGRMTPFSRRWENDKRTQFLTSFLIVFISRCFTKHRSVITAFSYNQVANSCGTRIDIVLVSFFIFLYSIAYSNQNLQNRDTNRL